MAKETDERIAKKVDEINKLIHGEKPKVGVNALAIVVGRMIYFNANCQPGALFDFTDAVREEWDRLEREAEPETPASLKDLEPEGNA